MHAAQIIQNAFRKYKVSIGVDMGGVRGWTIVQSGMLGNDYIVATGINSLFNTDNNN